MNHLSFADFCALQTEATKPRQTEDFPAMMTLRRQGIRIFPDQKSVATYKDFATNKTYVFPQVSD